MRACKKVTAIIMVDFNTCIEWGEIKHTRVTEDVVKKYPDVFKDELGTLCGTTRDANQYVFASSISGAALRMLENPRTRSAAPLMEDARP